MKNIIRKYNLLTVFLFVVLFFCVSEVCYSDNTNPVDTAVVVVLENQAVNSVNKTFRFDIYLVRNSEMWHLWENATFQMAFFTVDGLEIDYSKFDVSVDASTSEILTLIDDQPAYDFYSSILYEPEPEASRVMLMVIGPEAAIHTKLFENNIKLKLCSITLSAKNSGDVTESEIPNSMEWKKKDDDELYYQATAYKYLEDVNNLPNYVIEASEEDNIEIGWVTRYDVNPAPAPTTLLAHFDVEYTGNLNAVCRYGTKSEINNAGFVIKRGEYRISTPELINYDTLPDSIFTYTVADYRLPEFVDRMKGFLYSHIGKEYDPIPDNIDFRAMNYVYRLYCDSLSETGDNKLIALSTDNLISPNGVIVEATASPNPCSGRSNIHYEVVDDVYLTCQVYDQNGGKIKTLHDDVNGLLEMKYVPRGKYNAIFEAPELAAQGLYDVYFVAYPVNDESVEISTANVKIQLIKDGAK